MPNAASITHLIEKVKTGDEDAAQRLWEFYFKRLIRLARARLPSAKCRAADEEDVVLSAMDSFFRRARKGKYEQLRDRNDLWRLLVKITFFKTCDLIKGTKRSESGESALDHGADPDQAVRGMDAQPDACAFPFDPGTMIIQLAEPEAMANFVKRLGIRSQELLAMLKEEEEMHRIALRRLQGFTLEEIAEELGCVPSTVNRKIERIRKIWSREIVP